MNGMVKPKTYGRMGNFLFQAATAIGYAMRHGMEFTLPTTTNDAYDNPIYLQHLVNPAFNSRLPEIRIKEKTHAYQNLPFEEAWRGHNIILDGYWQSEKYFKEFREDILRLFAFPYKKMAGVVSVHVRRGDYLVLTKKHPPVSIEWMLKAMGLFPGFKFMFFSDDIAWCKDTFKHRDDCTFSEGKNIPTDLEWMSCCEHNICSASTYSWWGAWLNQNPDKRIVIPDWWFQPSHKKFCDTSDIVPADWERLGN